MPKRHILERAGIQQAAREVILTGSDEGEIETAPKPGGKIHYARSVPLGKAADDILLAWPMNGADLTRAHGFPLRAIVRGCVWDGVGEVVE